MFEYHVDAFAPPASGCGKQDAGWDSARCGQFKAFLNAYAKQGWKLHSCEYRPVLASSGCGKTNAVWLVCVFEHQVPD
jgi:hypothetical protein